MPLLPENLQRALVQKSKELMVYSGRYRAFDSINMRIYGFMESMIRNRLSHVQGVRAVYLCHGLATGECYPGLSDFDVTVVFEDDDPLAFYARLRKEWGSMKRYIPINDMSLLTVAEFTGWQKIGGGWDPRDEVRHWKLLAGTELRDEEWDLTTQSAELDRIQFALGHFQNLMNVAIKEEPRSRLMAIIARRQLYKCFWNSILSLSPEYLALPTQRERIAAWIRDNGEHDIVKDLALMYDAKFTRGPVTTLRFAASALAYELIDKGVGQLAVTRRPLTAPTVTGLVPAPLDNDSVVTERAQAMCASILEMLEAKIESITLSSTGTARGWALYVILKDGLSQEEIASALVDMRAIHRVFDDPWFNEHFPAGIPLVCSRNMFVARLQGGRSSLHYFEALRHVLHGADIYAEALAASPPLTKREAFKVSTDDWHRERLIFSLYLHQIYLGWLKPALHDYVTFYYPRLSLHLETGSAPATAEDAAWHYATHNHDEEHSGTPHLFLDAFRGRDLDRLLKKMHRDDFIDVWPLLSQGLYRDTVRR